MVSCFDIVSMVVEEATQKYASVYKLNKTNYGYLETYCKIIDNLADEFDADSFEASINDRDMTVAVSMCCEDLTVRNCDHAFYALTEHATSISLAVKHEDCMKITFEFPSVWMHL